MLLGIKAANDGLGWDEIGEILNIPKDEVKFRWKEIKDKPADLTRRKYKTPGISNENTCESGQVSKRDDDKIGDGTESPADGEDQSVSNSSSSALSCCDSLWKEKHLQRRYWLKHISSNLYPPYVELEADACFSQRDCEILKTLDSQYRKCRWLEIQANFYNATGRMIPLERIRTKLEQAEHLRAHLTKEQTVDGESVCARRKRSIEEWIADIILEAPTGPGAS
ncbi:hypothetical protein K4F52_007626 [Lecanicillium sp. MT-2017a]|nr:hypothetical protein K4F52_007626 [Lecanicillium sp. MT-2017a]